MEPEVDPQLEALVDRELRQLPPVKAPDTLMPRVLAALQAQAARPWWQRPWWDWPFGAKIVFVVLVLGIAGLVTGGGFVFGNPVTALSQQVAEQYTPLANLTENFRPLLNALLVLWNKLFAPFMLYGAVLLGAAYVVALAAGTMFVRVAVKRF